MDTPLSRKEWAAHMAEIVQHKARAQEQRHQTAVLQQAQAEQVWVKGIDEVVQTLEGLVQALKQTRQFPHVALLLHARSPQGTSTYMRRGTLLSLKGLGESGLTVDFEIDTAPPFRADVLAPTIRVITKPDTAQAAGARHEQCCFGISVRGDVVWHPLTPALVLPQEGSVEEMLRGLLTALLVGP